MTELFTIIETQIILLNKSGVYKQAKLALREQGLYANINGGFIRLYADKVTSSPALRWHFIECFDDYSPDSLGRLICKKKGEPQL